MIKKLNIDTLQLDDVGFPIGAVQLSIAMWGVLSPPIVHDNQDGTYNVLDGKARVLAANQLGIKTIDCEVVNGSCQSENG